MHDWEEIRRQCGQLVWAAAYRILKNHDQALDCCQEVFLEAFERSQREIVRDWPSFSRWLAVHRALDRLRKGQRASERISTDSDVTRIAGGTEPFAEIEFRELVERVRLEMARLPLKQAEAFWSCCIEEMSYADAASQMGIDVKSVGVLIHRARSRLRELLADLSPTRTKL